MLRKFALFFLGMAIGLAILSLLQVTGVANTYGHDKIWLAAVACSFIGYGLYRASRHKA